MAKIKKEQLKSIINKEFAYVIKEAKKNDAYFNQIAREQVIRTLIKEGTINEQWWNRELMQQYKELGPTKPEDMPGYGQGWDETRRKQGLVGPKPPPKRTPVRPALGYEDAPAGEGPFQRSAGPPAMPGEPPAMPGEPPAEEDAGGAYEVDFGEEGKPQVGFPNHRLHDITSIGQGSALPGSLKNRLPDVAESVFTKLGTDIPALTDEATIELTIEIIRTVVDTLGTSSKYGDAV